MVEITKYARNKLLETLSANLEYSNDYGTPPIFNWYRNMIDSSLLIDNCRYIRRGQYRYNLGQSLGFAHITIDYVGRTRFIIITDYEINENSLFSWQDSNEESGIIPKEKTRIRKNWRKINKQPLFGYQYIINDKGEYNLINNQEQPITQWFKDIKTPFKQPYGKYKIIAYLNIGGFAYALSIDGQTYPLNRMWKEVYGESITYLKELILLEERNWKNCRINDYRFKQIIHESLLRILNEEKGKKKVGDYTALDGQWMLTTWSGIENKGKVQDIRMYDKDLFKGQEDFDTIALFRRQDNLKFFYARIVPVGENDTKWKEIPLKDVPQIIKNDFKTINLQGRVPYRVH